MHMFIIIILYYVFCLDAIAGNTIIGLSQAYKMALEHEAKLKSIGYQVEAKEQDVKQAESQLYPHQPI